MASVGRKRINLWFEQGSNFIESQTEKQGYGNPEEECRRAWTDRNEQEQRGAKSQ